MVSGEDTNLAGGRSLVLAIKDSWSAFVSKSGIKLFAAKGDFDLHAQSGNIQVLADQDADSTKGELKVPAKQYIKGLNVPDTPQQVEAAAEKWVTTPV